LSETSAISRLADAERRLDGLGVRLRVIATGIATVDLDQAEERARATVAVRAVTGAPDDLLLGARCRIVLVDEGPSLVLLEPSTEGRLAASLARYGQGPVVSYLTTLVAGEDVVGPAAAAGVRLSPPAPGPLGVARLVLGGAASGPHLIVVEAADHAAGAAGSPTATIER
jgi:hypothetical protein